MTARLAFRAALAAVLVASLGHVMGELDVPWYWDVLVVVPVACVAAAVVVRDVTW